MSHNHETKELIATYEECSDEELADGVIRCFIAMDNGDWIGWKSPL